MPLSLDSLSSLFAPLGLISSLILAGALFWIVFRTRSTHIFLFRIWRLASGGVEVKDQQIQAYLEKQNSLMSFRFVSGLLSKRIEDAHDMIAFGKELGDETLEDFRNAGKYFDPVTRRVDRTAIPGWFWQGRNILFAVVGIVMFYVALNAMIFQAPAFVQLRSTGTFFMLSPVSAKARPFVKDVRAVDCRPNRVLPTDRGFTPAEVKIVCEILTDVRLEGFLKPVLKEQGRLFLVILIAGACVAVNGIRAQLEIGAARKLATKLDDHAVRSEQLDQSKTKPANSRRNRSSANS